MLESNDIPGKWCQVTAAIVVNLGEFIVGMTYGWTSALTETFQDANNTLGIEAMSEDDCAWLSSSMSLSVLLTLSFGSSLCEHFGRKTTAILEAAGFIICWLLRLFPSNYYTLLVAQLLTGASDGLCSLVIGLYVTEIASDAIRGRLGALYMFAFKAGYLFAFILAAVLPYQVMTGCALIPTLIHLAGLTLLPETPVYLIRKNRSDEATKSLMWLRGNDKATVEFEQLQIVEFLHKIMNPKESLGIGDLFTDRTNFKGLMITLAMITILELSGVTVVTIYIVRIIEEVNAPIDPYVASILYASLQLLACFMSTMTVDHFGRRPLLLFSASSMAVCHSVVGIFLILQYFDLDVIRYSWLPLTALSLFGFCHTIGFGALAYVVSNEVFHPELAGFCNTVFLIGYSIYGFLAIKLFPLAIDTIGFHNCFFIFGFTCICGFFVVLFMIPETKGRSIESIREELQGVNKRNNDVEIVDM